MFIVVNNCFIYAYVYRCQQLSYICLCLSSPIVLYMLMFIVTIVLYMLMFIVVNNCLIYAYVYRCQQLSYICLCLIVNNCFIYAYVYRCQQLS